MGLHSKKQIKLAFTMAEAILVMTILGIIATIMITTLKPAEFKEKALAILAKKVLSEIDTATTQILINDTKDGTFNTIISPTNGGVFKLEGIGGTVQTQANVTFAINELELLYKKYLTTIRKPCTSEAECGVCGKKLIAGSPGNAFYLKDGACVSFQGIMAQPRRADTIFPGETETTSMLAFLFLLFDVNGLEEPNTFGKDQFILPLSAEGIKYSN